MCIDRHGIAGIILAGVGHEAWMWLLEGDEENMAVKVERALLTVADKEGVVELGRGLEMLGIELIAPPGGRHGYYARRGCPCNWYRR